MADGVEVKIEGLKPVLDKMHGLTPRLRAKGARSAMRKAANIVRDAALANARRINDAATAEDISKNIAVRFSSRTLKRSGDLLFRVGVQGGAKQYSNTKDNVRKRRAGKTYKTGGDKSNPGGDTFYWRFVEFGTSRARAHPFMQPALAQNVNSAIDTAAVELEKAIDKIMKKQAQP